MYTSLQTFLLYFNISESTCKMRYMDTLTRLLNRLLLKHEHHSKEPCNIPFPPPTPPSTMRQWHDTTNILHTYPPPEVVDKLLPQLLINKSGRGGIIVSFPHQMPKYYVCHFF